MVKAKILFNPFYMDIDFFLWIMYLGYDVHKEIGTDVKLTPPGKIKYSAYGNLAHIKLFSIFKFAGLEH